MAHVLRATVGPWTTMDEERGQSKAVAKSSSLACRKAWQNESLAGTLCGERGGGNLLEALCNPWYKHTLFHEERGA